MLRIFSKWWARLSYLWSLEIEGHKNDINAATAKRNAEEKRGLVAQLNGEADAIEKNIKEFGEKEEKGYWTCPNGHEIPGPAEDEIKKANESGVATAPGQCKECGKYLKFLKRDLMSGQEKYESDKERKDAEQMIAEKRGLAAQEAKNVSDAEQVAQVLRGRAADSRAFADKIRQI